MVFGWLGLDMIGDLTDGIAGFLEFEIDGLPVIMPRLNALSRVRWMRGPILYLKTSFT